MNSSPNTDAGDVIRRAAFALRPMAAHSAIVLEVVRDLDRWLEANPQHRIISTFEGVDA